MDINCFSISSTDQLDLVYILLNSLRYYKQKETNIKYYLLLDLTQQKNTQYCMKYFESLTSKDFIIIIIDVNTIMPFIDKSLKPPHYTYLKCFAPKMFKTINKILYLDTDMAFNSEGVEQLWNTNISRYYCAAVEEPIVTYYKTSEMLNTKVKNYFNAGMMLMNLKKIRKDKIDDEMVNMLIKWDYNKVKPIVVNQSLFNYVFKQKVKFLDFKYNNSILVATPVVLNAFSNFLNQKYNGIGFKQSVMQAVILHFLGQNKPWKENVRKYYTKERDFSFKRECINVWDIIYNNFKNMNDDIGDNDIVNADVIEYYKNSQINKNPNTKKIYFISRISRLENLEDLKKNIKSVFKNTNLNYQHILLFDLTKLKQQEINFQEFKDQKTTIYKVPWKQTFDKYMYYNINEVIKRIEDKDCWIYILDDDNKLLKDFTKLETELDTNYPVTIFNTKVKKASNTYNGIIKEPLKSGEALCHIDLSNYIVHKSVFDKCKFGNKRYSGWSDGIFIEKILKAKYPIKYLNQFLCFYKGL